MTEESNLAAGAMSAGADLPATDGALHVSDIAAMIREIEAHIDLHDVGETASTWLANARGALRSALQYVESHLADIEAKAKAEVTEITAKISEPLSEADAIAAHVDAACSF
ncbi:hypothetical protein [Bradyrhizobium sp. SBR1B]|uniref:hypothetical protein n=1 Tax=Bradyrhizobium sp. SBR1B TaxID=2663836 RepID=UPI0016067E77|nr:hypothetical protein [Bradyrhizobium sp. SBR1B]MBB4377239.1 putative nucleic acid-binding Zn-ribbon protein [Bradyrhizobium sp. SBR1B]